MCMGLVRLRHCEEVYPEQSRREAISLEFSQPKLFFCLCRDVAMQRLYTSLKYIGTYSLGYYRAPIITTCPLFGHSSTNPPVTGKNIFPFGKQPINDDISGT